MKCIICQHEIGDLTKADHNGVGYYHRNFCPGETERSGAAQRCPPSAMGSASAAPQEPQAVKSQAVQMARLPSNGKAEDEASDDSSVVQLPVSDPVADTQASIKRLRAEVEAYPDGTAFSKSVLLSVVESAEILVEIIAEREAKQANGTPSAAGVSGGS